MDKTEANKRATLLIKEGCRLHGMGYFGEIETTILSTMLMGLNLAISREDWDVCSLILDSAETLLTKPMQNMLKAAAKYHKGANDEGK